MQGSMKQQDVSKSQGIFVLGGKYSTLNIPVRFVGCEIIRLLQFHRSSPSSFCGNSSVGRAPRCQRGCREFKSRFPLHFKDRRQTGKSLIN